MKNFSLTNVQRDDHSETTAECPVRLSILIVNYNGMAYLGPCLETIYRHMEPGSQVILEDNGSTDLSIQAAQDNYPWLEIVRSDQNLGFAGGTNLAAKSARGRFLLLLNPDTLLTEPLAPIVDWLESRHEHGALTITMVNGDGVSSACTGKFPSPWRLILFRSMLVSPAQYGDNDAYDVDWLQGSFLLLRADLWRRLHGLDERYFMYAEDVDLCKRIWNSGYRCAYLPRHQYVHLGGYNSSRFAEQVCSLATYVESHMSGLQLRSSRVVLYFGCLARAAFYWARGFISGRQLDRTIACASWRALTNLSQRTT